MSERVVTTKRVDEPREAGGEAAEIAHVVGAEALVEEAEEKEEASAGEGFGEDLEDAAVEAADGEGEDAEDDEAEGGESGEGGEALEIFLDEGHEGAVDDAEGAERGEQRGDAVGLIGEDAEGEAEDGVEAELADEDHDGGGGGFRDGVGHPAVEREDGDLDGERDEEGERGEPEGGGGAGDAVLGGEKLELREIKGAGGGVDPEHADEQDGGGDKGVQEVLDGGAAAVFGASEGRDEDRHRDERELPEGVIEEEVERAEDAEHGDLLEKEEDVEGLLAGADGVPAGEDAEGGEEAGEDDEPHGEAVDAEVVGDVGIGDPGVDLLELELAVGGVGGGVAEVRGEVEREEKGEEGDGESAVLHGLAAIGQEREEEGAGERDEDDEGKDDVVEVHRAARVVWLVWLIATSVRRVDRGESGGWNSRSLHFAALRSG